MEEAHAVRRTAKKTLAVYAVIFGVTAALYLIYLLHAVVLQLVVALILAVALEPFVQFLLRRGLKRGWAIGITIFAACVLLLAAMSLIILPLISEGTKLVENAPQLVASLTHNEQIQYLNARYHLVDQLKSFSETQALSLAGNGLPFIGVLGGIIGGLSSVVIIFIFAFFFLLEGPKNWHKALTYLHPTHTERVERAAQKMARAVGGFVTGNLLISLIAGIVTLITLLILRVPYAFALAAIIAIFDLIPLIGAAIGTIIVGLVALTQGVVPAIIVVGVLLIYQAVEGHLIQPLVYSRVISLSPLLIILASIIGAELAGIVGVLLAIPVAAVLQIAVLEGILVMKEVKHEGQTH